MKKLLLVMLLTCALVTSVSAGKKKRPETVGEKGPKIVVFNAGRPWMGQSISNLLATSGCRAVCVDSRYLDGFGGASIKVNMTDVREPEPWDGITPALSQLSTKKLVVFHDFKDENLTKMLTPERIAQLRAFVEKGGHILFTIHTPFEVGDLLPVKLGEYESVEGEDYVAKRPSAPEFAAFPETMPVFKQFRQAVPVDGAEVLSNITIRGYTAAPYLVRKKLGEGSVTFFNGEYTYAHQLKEFSNWAYGAAFFCAVAANAGDIKLDAEKKITVMQPIPGRNEIGEVSVAVKSPVIGITPNDAAVSVADNTATFGNGCKITLSPLGSVSVSYPGVENPLIRKYNIPEISYSTDRSFFDDKTAEATDAAATLTAADIKWQVASFTAEGNTAVITYTAPDSEMRWIFTAGKLDLDGREYAGIADRVEIVKCPLYLNALSFKAELTPPEPLFARRNSCYSPPRGYSDFDMSGKTDGDTSNWSFFGSGQPFELVACQNGVYLANIEEAESMTAQLIRKKGSAFIDNIRNVGVGRVHAPVATKNYWHWFSAGPERGHNEYLAMYQLQRRDLRRKAGLKELPAYPICRYSHQISKEEQKAVRDAAIKAGYRFLALPGVEEPPDHSYSPDRHPMLQELQAAGVGAHIWTAGSYVQGDGGWIYQNHPEWFVRDKNGKIFAYAGKRYPVIDVNNPEFFEWYCSIAKPAIERGVKWVYRDMDGAAAGAVNYAKEESPNGMASQIKFYRFFHENGCRVAIEGMNPLALDEYWYRPALYKPFTGNEFCLVGSVPSANFHEGLELDFFRTGMFGCFPITELSGYTFQFDRVKDEVVRANRMVSLVPKFNETLDHVGMPFIRETEFGTTWIGDKGGALLFWNPAKKVTVELPEGWKIRGVEGNVLTDVQADAIYLLEKK
ncbi:MAG: hypothetical protein MJ016_02330 [Victivallaceae bacterium]|nr:hypothetical protein [Victivallaceae bacterium]